MLLFTFLQRNMRTETNYERFLNKEEGYKSLLCWLKKKNMAKKRLVISMENTGIYSFDLCLF